MFEMLKSDYTIHSRNKNLTMFPYKNFGYIHTYTAKKEDFEILRLGIGKYYRHKSCFIRL